MTNIPRKIEKKEITIKLPHLSIAAIEYGPLTGEVVIGMHGWLDNAATFEHLAPYLKDIRLISIDLVGHGLSDWRPMGAQYHMIDFVTDLFDVAKTLNLEKFSIMGHSLGAAIGSLAAGLMPEKINKLALIDGLGPFTSQAKDISEHYKSAYQKYLQLPRKKLPTYNTFEEALTARAHSGKMHPNSAKPLVERGSFKNDSGFSWRTDPKLTNPSFLQLSEEQTIAILNNIQAPTCLIVASDGLLPNFPAARERALHLHHLEKHHIEGGHHLHLDSHLNAPKEIANVLNLFLK